MAVKFKTQKLVSDDAASRGIDVRAEKWGHYAGTFSVRFINAIDQSVERTLDRIRRSHAYQRKQKNLSDLDGVIVVLGDYALLGWSDIVDEDDKPVPFTSENAIAFLSMEENTWIALELIQAATNGENFQPVEEFKPAKNSVT